nr:TOBE domain-containing protein [Promineifilum sp.]
PGRINAQGEVETAVGRFRPMGGAPRAGEVVELLIKPVAAGYDSGSQDNHPRINTLDATVDAVTFRGRFSQIWITANGQRLLFEESGSPSFGPGDAIRITIAPEQLQLYESSPNEEGNSRN